MTYSPQVIVLEPKHPGETVDYPVTLTPWIPTGDAVDTLTSVIASTGLTVESVPAPEVVGGVLTFWLSGGTSGSTYSVQAIFVTVDGRTFVVDFQVTVYDPTP